MSEFDELEKKAEAYAEEHPEQADKGINEVAGFAERDTDHQHDEQIDRAVETAERHIGQRLPRVLQIGIRHRGILALDIHAGDLAGMDRVDDLDHGQPAHRIERLMPELFEGFA